MRQTRFIPSPAKPTHAMLRLALATLVLAAVPVALRAHDLQTRISVAPPYVAVQASYDSEAASFVAVTVHAPAEAGIKADAFQTGRTDFAGNFVFQPSTPGEWRVVLDDEMGHRVEVKATVASLVPGYTSAVPGSSAAQAEARGSGERLLIGLSLLIGAAGFLYGWMARRDRSA